MSSLAGPSTLTGMKRETRGVGSTDSGAEALAVEVLVYRDGELVQREACESTEAAAEVARAWAEVDGVECVIDDLAVKHADGQILAPEEEDAEVDDDYPHDPS